MKKFNLLMVLFLTSLLIIASGCGTKEEEPAETPEPATEEPVAVAADYTPSAEQIGMEAVDPVCGMKVTVAEDTPALVYQDEVYFFCSAEDKASFAADPESYMMKEGAEAEGEMMMEEGEGETEEGGH